MPLWFMQYIWNGYFDNAWKKTRDTNLHSWRSFFEKSFCLVFFLWKIERSPTYCRNLQYNTSQERLPMPPRLGDTSQQEIPKFSTCKLWDDWIYQRRAVIFHRWSPSGAQGRKAGWTNSGMTPTRPNLRASSSTPKHFTAVSYYATKRQVTGWPYRVLR